MKPQPDRLTSPPEATVPPWWRVGMVWLILGGPLVVVVASLVTVAIAVSGAEEVLTRPTASVKNEQPHMLPAVQGRNHAASPRN